tara:strand:+ start:1178 stop:1708 length:531 start_codon:yes stop_codon:yes gene_type:complete
MPKQKFEDVTSIVYADMPKKMKTFIAWAKKRYGYSKDDAAYEFQQKKRQRVWQSADYVVCVTTPERPGGWTHLSIKNLDRSSRHDWRDFQDIKNQLVGTEVEAMELYPAESRLLDECNQFHLWCLPEGEQVPCGRFAGRRVDSEPKAIGTSQRGETGIEWYRNADGVLVELPEKRK